MPSLEDRVDALINKIDNQRCADCFDKQPANVAILMGGLEKPIGAFICFRCARVHEKFGNDLGYVLNARNENDWSEEEVQALERGGNKIVNAIFESKIAYDHPRPDVNSQHDERAKFCTDKYIERLFFSESKAAKLMKAPPKQASGRFNLKAPKDSGSARGFNSSDSSGDFGFSGDEDFGYEDAAPEVAAVNNLSLDAAPVEQQRPRQRRTRRRGSVGGVDPNAPRGPPSRAMSLQVDGANPNARRQRPGRRSSLGRTSSMGGASLGPAGGEGAPAPRSRRPGRRGSISAANSASGDSLSGASQPRSRRPGRRGSVGSKDGSLDNHFNNSNHSTDFGDMDGKSAAGDGKSVGSRRRLGKGNDPLGGSSHHGQPRRRPQRRGSIGVEDANIKLNEKKEMVW
mmetsp:Transcript_11025/g.26641  ORF Transcript_11025/g.26641 Transcript_11025/m.26641 type:complete len:400 (+) Transcript_11025:92-1291(+)